MNKRMVIAATAASAAGLGVSAVAASAADYLYYSMTTGPSTTIGRVELDGTTGRNDSFVGGWGSANIYSMAATGSSLYVSAGNSPTSAKITRVDSSGTKTEFFGGAAMCSNAPSAATEVKGLATDGQWLYYICESGTTNTSARSLARVSLDGATRDEGFSGSLSGIHASSSVFAVSGGYAYFRGGTSGGGDRLYRVALTAGATATAASSAEQTVAAAGSPAGIVALGDGGSTRPVLVFQPSAFPGWTAATRFPGQSIPTGVFPGSPLAANTDTVFWPVDTTPKKIAKGAIAGTSEADLSFLVAASGSGTFGRHLAVDPLGPGGGSTPTPTPTPTPTSTGSPTPTTRQAATTLRTPTVDTNPRGENAVVSVAVQLAEKGQYTFIFERSTSNETSREQATSNRVPMQKGTKIGKRKLNKAYTAAVITTTQDNAKLVTRALLRKAQAKKLNLRVVYAPSGNAKSESVIKIK